MKKKEGRRKVLGLEANFSGQDFSWNGCYATAILGVLGMRRKTGDVDSSRQSQLPLQPAAEIESPPFQGSLQYQSAAAVSCCRFTRNKCYRRQGLVQSKPENHFYNIKKLSLTIHESVVSGPF